jgi:hypothetical protein
VKKNHPKAGMRAGWQKRERLNTIGEMFFQGIGLKPNRISIFSVWRTNNYHAQTGAMGN